MNDIQLANVESFDLDHTAVIAPYLRRISVQYGAKGDAISNFDLRLVQPNVEEIPTAGLHTIEHVLAALLRARLSGLIDISPFGCRTGFHVLVWGEPTIREVALVVKACLEDIVERVRWEDVPGVSALGCGNYRDHSLHSAKEWCKVVLANGISIDPFSRIVLG